MGSAVITPAFASAQSTAAPRWIISRRDDLTWFIGSAAISYLALVFTVFWLIFRMRQKPVSQLLLAEMLVCLLSPTGIRWLTGGMETSLTNLFVVALWSSSRSK